MFSGAERGAFLFRAREGSWRFQAIEQGKPAILGSPEMLGVFEGVVSLNKWKQPFPREPAATGSLELLQCENPF